MSTKKHELYAAIGELVVRFQELESGVGVLSMELAGADVLAGRCISSETSFSRLVAALCSIARLRFTDKQLLDQLDDLAKQLSDAQAKRNAVLHSTYDVTTHGDDVLRIRFTAKQRRGLRLLAGYVEPDEIRGHVEDVERAKQSLANFAAALKTKGLLSDRQFK